MWIWVGRPCLPVLNDFVTSRHLFFHVFPLFFLSVSMSFSHYFSYISLPLELLLSFICPVYLLVVSSVFIFSPFLIMEFSSALPAIYPDLSVICFCFLFFSVCLFSFLLSPFSLLHASLFESIFLLSFIFAFHPIFFFFATKGGLLSAMEKKKLWKKQQQRLQARAEVTLGILLPDKDSYFYGFPPAFV